MNIFDEPEKIKEHQNRFEGGKALVVLGGVSGKGWARLRDEIKPDVIISTSGATSIPAEYWIEGENMNRAFHYAMRGNQYYKRFMHVFEDENPAKWRLINFQNWVAKGQSVAEYYKLDQENTIKINRIGIDDTQNFDLREYGEGLLYGWKFRKRKELGCRTDWRVGTVGTHAVHLAGILGCAEVFTIGFDLCFKNGIDGKQHWYDHPEYKPDAFRTHKVFTTYDGLETQWDWIETAEFIASLEDEFREAGLKWIDHSEGLLKKMGIWCAV